MAQRRYGPTQDAGVVIIEKESEKQIVQSSLGSTAMVGVLERGPVGELISVSGKLDLAKKIGGIIPESHVPGSAADFWKLGEGAGTLFLARVTDGTEVESILELRDRTTDRGKVIKLEAKNGGGWGGRRQTWVLDLALVGDLNETTIDLPIAFHPILADQFKGGQITLTEATGTKVWDILGNDASDGVAKTELRLAANAKALTEFGSPGAPTYETVIEVSQVDQWGRSKQLAAAVKDGVENPSTEFGLTIYLNDDLVLDYADLSMDQNSAKYFVDIITDDGNNHYIKVTDLFVGTPTAANRPANFYATVAVAEFGTSPSRVLNLGTVLVLIDASAAVDNTIAAFTFGSKVIADRYEVEVDTISPTVWKMESLDQQAAHVFTAPGDGVPTVADNDYSIGFTATGVTALVGEKFTLTVIPLVEDEAINGKLFLPDVATAPAGGYNISDNTESEITVATGDITTGVPATTAVRLEYKQQFGFGYDGIAGIGVTDFTDIYDPNTSVFRQLVDKGYGLVKFATPGISDFSAVVSSFTDGMVAGTDYVLVEKAGAAYAESKNYGYRYEVKKTIVDEFAAKAAVQDVLGKNTFAKVKIPSWGSVADPVLVGRRKSVPTSGMALGREAREARNYSGYHKVAAGTTVTLPDLVDIPTGETILDGEILNPAGLQRINKKGGNYVIWGARIPSSDPAFVFTQHRELLSHYEHVLAENFDWIIFAINNKTEQPKILSQLNAYFLPEWRVKGALQGDSFAEAAVIKLDDENNTAATRAAGDMNAEIELWLADTIERFVITISKKGISESVA